MRIKFSPAISAAEKRAKWKIGKIQRAFAKEKEKKKTLDLHLLHFTVHFTVERTSF